MHPEKTIIVAFLIRIYIDESNFKKGYIYIYIYVRQSLLQGK